MIDWLLHPLTYAFMGRGLLAAVMVGILCSVIGCSFAVNGFSGRCHGSCHPARYRHSLYF
jgi:ABC-type Mn2+/Zn2+ transport system permease subunit